MAGVEEGPVTEGPSLTVGAYLGTWLEHVRTRVRPSTYDGYYFLVTNHAVPTLGHLPLGELHPLHVQRLYARMLSPAYGGSRGPVSAKTVGNLHRVLRQAMAQAVAWRLMSWNPATAAQPPRSRGAEPAVIDRDLAVRLLAAAAGSRFELPVALAVATGMRRGEILGLRWSDLDDGWEVARVVRSLQATRSGLAFEEPKTRRSRRAVGLPAFLHPYLQRQRISQDLRRDGPGQPPAGVGLVVDSGDGSPWNPDNFSRGWPEFLRARSLPHVRFHDLRHAHATFMLLQGVHPKVVSERLGHASVGITLDTYSHVLPTMQSEAVAAFDRLFASA